MGAEGIDKIWFQIMVKADGTEDKKPEGIPIELANLLIRIFDTCGTYGINLSEALRMKMAYNKTRPYRHGGKVI